MKMFMLIIFACCCSSVNAYNDPGTLDILSFNVQIFGTTKLKKPLVRDLLPKIIRQYDLALIQEIRDSTGKSIESLLNLVNSKEKNKYKVLLSPRLGRSFSKEEYAYIYREDWLTALDFYTYSDPDDVFEREPFIALFSTNDLATIKEFAVVGIHTSPKDAENEISHLVDVFDDIYAKWNVEDVIIMGDFNAGCSYVSHWENVSLATDDRFYWLIDDTKDTTTKDSYCAYDRMVVSGKYLLQSIVPWSPSVFHFEDEYDLTKEEMVMISDHFPIQVQIRSQDEKDAIGITASYEVYDKHVSEYLSGSPEKVFAMKREVVEKLPHWKLNVTYTKTGGILETVVHSNVVGIRKAVKNIMELSGALPDFLPPTQISTAFRLLRQRDARHFLPRGFGRYQTLYDYYKSTMEQYSIRLKCFLETRNKPYCRLQIMSSMGNIPI